MKKMVSFLALAALLATLATLPNSGQVFAAGGVVKSPTGTAPDRYAYYPGTEKLAKDEVRVIACGTGMPEQRRGAASACFLFEFGNGEFLTEIDSDAYDWGLGIGLRFMY